jgi:hypothetical protein
MKSVNVSLRTTSAVAKTVAGIALLSGAVIVFAPWTSLADPLTPLPPKGVSPYVTHFIFRPLMAFDQNDLGVGKAAVLEAVGTTQNLKGEAMLDKMAARCVALSVDVTGKKYIDGICVLTDTGGDKIVSTFDTREIDKSQPEMSCGTHVIVGGTGKYQGITGREPFACNAMPALAGPGGYTAMDIPHNTSWEIKK